MFLLEWLEYLVSWVLVKFHSLFTAIGFPSDSGFAWGASIVCLVIVIRICALSNRPQKWCGNGCDRASSSCLNRRLIPGRPKRS